MRARGGSIRAITVSRAWQVKKATGQRAPIFILRAALMYVLCLLCWTALFYFATHRHKIAAPTLAPKGALGLAALGNASLTGQSPSSLSSYGLITCCGSLVVLFRLSLFFSLDLVFALRLLVALVLFAALLLVRGRDERELVENLSGKLCPVEGGAVQIGGDTVRNLSDKGAAKTVGRGGKKTRQDRGCRRTDPSTTILSSLGSPLRLFLLPAA